MVKNITKAILQNEHGINRIRPSSLDRITSVSDDRVNAETYNNSELRDILIALPYGISSMPLDNMSVQIISNNGKHIAVGIIDPDKPKAPIGGLVLYDKNGNKITLSGDNISIENKGGNKITLSDNIDIKHGNGSNITMSSNDIVFSDGKESVSISDIISHMNG